MPLVSWKMPEMSLRTPTRTMSSEISACADPYAAHDSASAKQSFEPFISSLPVDLFLMSCFSVRAADPFRARIVFQQRHGHRALVDVALVGDLAAVDGRRLGQQQRPRRVGGGSDALRFQLRQSLRDRGA